jgi:Erythromycin biosynthesis protein CIII-like, N-terminal domain
MLHDLRPLVDEWRPDIIVHEAGELAAPIVAARLGVPNVCQGYGGLVAPERNECRLRRSGAALA